MAALKLYGDPISGNCLKAKWTANYIGADIEWIPLDIMKGETRTEEFLAINPFGQIPVAVLSDGRVITQSNAIMVYLAESFGGSLLPNDAYGRSQVFQWLFWEQNSHEPYIAGRRFRKAFAKLKDEDIDAEWLPRGSAALSFMECALEANDYLVGSALTLADIAVVAYTRVAEEGGFELSKYPAVQRWVVRVDQDLSISKSEVG